MLETGVVSEARNGDDKSVFTVEIQGMEQCQMGRGDRPDIGSSIAYPAVLIGSREEAAGCREIVAGRAGHAFNLAGKTTLGELAAVISMSTLHLGSRQRSTSYRRRYWGLRQSRYTARLIGVHGVSSTSDTRSLAHAMDCAAVQQDGMRW